MSTIATASIIVDHLKHDGLYQGVEAPDNPRALAIFEYYSTLAQIRIWSVHHHERELQKLYDSSYVRSPVLLWDQKNGLTETGKEFMEKHGEAIGPDDPTAAE